MRENYAEHIRSMYPVGSRILLVQMGDDPRPIPPNTMGSVVAVDDMGTVHCIFDNGRRLGLIPGEDVFHKVESKNRGGDAR